MSVEHCAHFRLPHDLLMLNISVRESTLLFVKYPIFRSVCSSVDEFNFAFLRCTGILCILVHKCLVHKRLCTNIPKYHVETDCDRTVLNSWVKICLINFLALLFVALEASIKPYCKVWLIVSFISKFYFDLEIMIRCNGCSAGFTCILILISLKCQRKTIFISNFCIIRELRLKYTYIFHI